MSAQAWILLAIFMGMVLAAGLLLAPWMTALAEGRVPRFVARIDRAILRLSGADPEVAMSWKQYAIAVMTFNIAGIAVVFALQMLQAALPLNPQSMPATSWHLALNTAVSFVTNTNWQAYGGESTMSYLVQMLALAVQNFLSAATGIAVAFALIRGLARRRADDIGNFWVDVHRVTVWLLLPICVVYTLFLVQQGSIQNFAPYVTAKMVEPVSYDDPVLDASGAPTKDDKGNPVTKPATTQEQSIAMGPVASQVAIKMLGTNGGGFMNANSSHAFENPTPLTDFVQIVSIFSIGSALCFVFGRMVGDRRQGWALWASMAAIFVVFAVMAMRAELVANPSIVSLGVDGSAGNLEGKEVRFGAAASALFAAVTTAASCGAVDSMHDAMMPLGGFAPMFLIQLGEVVFGGVGSGLYGMLTFAVVAVFVAGLMVGRTPEYIGKKIESFEMKMASIALLVTPALVLFGTALAVATGDGRAGIANPGAHGFSEILYAFASAANNNGSAFGGLSVNTPFYNLALAFAMFVGRFGVILPVLAIAGSMARKPRIPVTAGTLPTHGGIFVVLLIGTVFLVGALNYVPALALGPLVEHLILFGSH